MSARTLPRRTLPLVDKPFRHETIQSYVTRLALINHIETDVLSELVVNGRTDRLITSTPLVAPVVIERLAILTGFGTERLRHVFHPRTAPAHPSGNAALQDIADRTSRSFWPWDKRPVAACRLCSAARIPTGHRIQQWLLRSQRVCLHHARWIGPPGRGGQIQLTATPEILDAQRRLQHLLKRHGHRFVVHALEDAENTIHIRDGIGIDPHLLDDREQRLLPHRDRELRTNQDAYHALLFPEVIALASLLVSASWRHQLSEPDYSRNRAARTRFAARVTTDLHLNRPWNDHTEFSCLGLWLYRHYVSRQREVITMTESRNTRHGSTNLRSTSSQATFTEQND